VKYFSTTKKKNNERRAILQLRTIINVKTKIGKYGEETNIQYQLQYVAHQHKLIAPTLPSAKCGECCVSEILLSCEL